MVLAMLGTASLAGCALTPPLPEDLDEYEWAFAHMKHPRLWQPSAADGYRQRLRLVVAPTIMFFKFSVSLDQDQQGQTVGKYVRYDRRIGAITEERRFNVPAGDMAALDKILAEKKILNDPREFWRRKDDADRICLDGVEVILERVTADGYSFSAANVSCAVTEDFYLFAKAMAHTAGSDVEQTFEALL